METAPQKLYLDLLKKTLSFTLWPEPPVPIETFRYRKGIVKRLLISMFSQLLKRSQFRVVIDRGYSEDQRAGGEIWPSYADTMIGLKRLDNIQSCVETTITEGIEGDLIETGVWRGGACIFMRAILAAYGIHDKNVYVADSFEGLPPPDPEKYPADKGDTLYTHEFLEVSQEEVADNFRRYGLLDDQVVFLNGYFDKTLPQAPMKKLSVLRLDGDMYSSTMDALTNLYPKLSRGGFCIVDDYGLKTCQQAITDFRKKHGIHEELIQIDAIAKYWRKT